MFPAPDGAGFRVVVLSADSTAHRRLLVRARTRLGYASAFGYERVAQVRRVLRTFNEAAAQRRSEEFLVLPTHAPGEASGDAGPATEHRGSGVREGTR